MIGYRANFEHAQEVRVPTPEQDNEATNKAYVDAAVAAAVSGDINASSLTTSGDLSVSGNSTFSGTSTFNGNSTFGNDIDVMGRVDAIDGRFYTLDVMGGVMASDIFVHGSLEMSGYRANFENAQEVRVPTPDQDNEATNKAYVDSLVSTSIASDNAKGLVQLAVTENVSNISEYYLTYEGSEGATNPAQGDLVLLTGQTTASENGIYEVSSVNLSSSYSSSSSSGPTASDYYVSLTRASNFDSADEFVTGSFVFVEKGAQLGQGYVLGELASEFALGTSALNYIQFTVDTTSDVAFDQSVSASSLTTSGDLSVSGNSTFSGTSTFDGTLRSNGMLEVMGPTMFSDINVMGRVDATEGRFFMLDVMGPVMASDIFVDGSLEMIGYRANFEHAQEVRVPTPEQDNEATNKAYVDAAVATNATAITAEATTARAAEQANATAITALQSDVDQNESDADAAITAEATARASAIAAAVSGDINASSLTCLLYTSPSPRDRLLSRMPSSA